MYYKPEFSLVNVIYKKLIPFPINLHVKCKTSTNFLNKSLTKNKRREICLRKSLIRYATVTNKLHVEHSNTFNKVIKRCNKL